MTIHSRQELAQKCFHGTGIELGVAAGLFSDMILGNSRVTLLYSVDRWTENHHSAAEYLVALRRLNQHGRRSVVMRIGALDAAALIPDNSLQFIYADLYAHDGQLGGEAFRVWWPKLQRGGIISGHDYSPRYQPTINAVDAFAAEHGLTIALTTDDELPSWFAIKN